MSAKSRHLIDRSAWLIAVATFVAAACTPDRPASPGTSSLSDAEAQLVGHEVAGDVEDVAGSFTLGGLLGPSFPRPAAPARAGLQPRPHATLPALTANSPGEPRWG